MERTRADRAISHMKSKRLKSKARVKAARPCTADPTPSVSGYQVPVAT